MITTDIESLCESPRTKLPKGLIFECNTPSRIDFICGRLKKTALWLNVFNSLFCLQLFMTLFQGESDFKRYSATISGMLLLTLSWGNINGRMHQLGTFRRHFDICDEGNEETEEEFRRWMESVEKRESKTGTLVFRVLMAFSLLCYLLF